MRRIAFLLLPIAIALVAGCRQEAPPPKVEAVPAEGKSAAAPAAGEGLCVEHGVLEAVCPKCNPALEAVFRAKGDWCQEHGFPESVCPVCRPESGGKPALDVADDGAPADGTRIRLKTDDTARLAGIETVKAVNGRTTTELFAPATIVHDATRIAHVNARSPGIVRRLHVDVGDTVKTGTVLAVVESAEVGAEQSRYAAAASQVRLAEVKFRRESELHQRGISARMEVEAAEQELAQARAEHAALGSSLGIVDAAAGSGGTYALTAPFPGVVTKRAVSLGQYIGTEEALFEIVDTSTLWAEVAVPEADLAAVRVGSAVAVTVDALGDREFSGTVAHLAPGVDPLTRTARVRVRLANHAGLLRANMFGKARIRLGSAQATAAVPRAAVQEAKSVQLAFVRLGPAEYETRRVRVVPGRWDAELVDLASGIEPGEEVVVAGSFFLKTETLKDSIGAGCCDVETK
jgi:cobalt-zinc-cadmium efflux system membrane fusion protein